MTMNERWRLPAAAAVGVIMLSTALPAGAQQQDQPQGDPESDEAPQFTEEVTVRVTARKREENLQSVPFSTVAPTQ